MLSVVNVLSSGGSGLSITDILSDASEVLNWLIKSMGSIVTFITANPAILVYFMVGLGFTALGMFLQIWHAT